MRHDAGGLVPEGVDAGTRSGLHGGHDQVHTDAQFRKRAVRLAYVAGPRLHVTADGQWRDELASRPLPELDGCIDVDIGITPATNTLPILRLGLAAGESREISAAYVPLPDQIEDGFLPRAAAQRYTCLFPRQRYRCEGLFRGFSTKLEVDADGLWRNYRQTFRRVDG